MKNRLKGVTLIETMLYIGIFSIIMVIIINFMLSTQEATRRNDVNSNLNRTSEFLSQHFSDSFDRALSINEPTTIFNDNQGVLVLNFSSDTKQYTLANSILYLNNVPITPSSLSVTQFYIQPIYKNIDTLIAVKISIIIQSEKIPSLTETLNLLEVIR